MTSGSLDGLGVSTEDLLDVCERVPGPSDVGGHVRLMLVCQERVERCALTTRRQARELVCLKGTLICFAASASLTAALARRPMRAFRRMCVLDDRLHGLLGLGRSRPVDQLGPMNLAASEMPSTSDRHRASTYHAAGRSPAARRSRWARGING
jgi:hypothetical protein